MTIDESYINGSPSFSLTSLQIISYTYLNNNSLRKGSKKTKEFLKKKEISLNITSFYLYHL